MPVGVFKFPFSLSVAAMVLTCATLSVADISVMLALMAGRNAGETYSVVQNNEVTIQFVSPHYISMLHLFSGQTSVGPHSDSAVPN